MTKSSNAAKKHQIICDIEELITNRSHEALGALHKDEMSGTFIAMQFRNLRSYSGIGLVLTTPG